MREHLLVLLFAGIFVYLITPYSRILAFKYGALAKVRDRDVHTQVTPRWGGTAIWLSLILATLIASQLKLLSKAFAQDQQIRGICIAATVICLLGVIDDKWGLDAITKLAGQTLAAAILVNFGVQLLWLPLNGVTMLPTSLGQLVTIVIILVTINAVNFIDGLDGLAAGVVAIAAGSFFAFAYLLSVVYNFDRAGAPSWRRRPSAWRSSRPAASWPRGPEREPCAGRSRLSCLVRSRYARAAQRPAGRAFASHKRHFAM